MAHLIRAGFNVSEAKEFEKYAKGLGITTLFYTAEGRNTFDRNVAVASGVGYDQAGNTVQATLSLYHVPPNFSLADDGSLQMGGMDKRGVMEVLKRYGVDQDEVGSLQSIRASSVCEISREEKTDDEGEEGVETVKVRRSRADLRFETKDAAIPELFVRPSVSMTYGRAALSFSIVIPKKEGAADPRAVIDGLKAAGFTVVRGVLTVGDR